MIVKMRLLDILHVASQMRESHKRDVLATFESIDHFCADRLLRSTVAYSLIHQGRPVACGGIVPKEQGTQEAWIVATNDIKKCGLELTRTARDALEAILSNGTDIRRVEGRCYADDKDAGKWAKIAGMKFDGMLPAAGPKGETMMLYAKTRGVT